MLTISEKVRTAAITKIFFIFVSILEVYETLDKNCAKQITSEQELLI